MSDLIEYIEKLKNCMGGGINPSNYFFSPQFNKIKGIASNIVSFNLLKQPIGIGVEQDTQTIEMMFGVAYSGNFYVPIDCALPEERLSLILKDLKLFLCKKSQLNETLKNLLEKLKIPFLVYEDNLNLDIKNEIKLDQIKNNISLDDPLFMIYTSGSTGTPKGVIKSHGAMAFFINQFLEKYNLNENDIIANQTPLYFDASSKDIYLSLISKAKLLFVPKQLFSFPVKLIEFLNEYKATTLFWVPSALSIVAKLKTFSYILPQSLKQIFFVGETFPIKYLNYWAEHLPSVKLVNLYGSSEMAGVICSYDIIHPLDETQKLPIGKPFKDCNIFIVDEKGEIAQQGEMIIESQSLASGYYNDLQKTSEKFISIEINGRVRRFFKSGDIAEKDQEGNLLFVSRNDFQIKHMGHRIELGDIETAAYSFNEIEDCCCCYDCERQKIIMYFKTCDNIILEAKTLKIMFSQKLPDYMLPARYIQMGELPKNKNGKIDRQKLKEMI